VFGHDEKLEEHGTRAPAEVVKAEQSRAGITVGNPAFAGATEVVWKLDVKVKPEGAEPFDAHVEARLPQYTALTAGSTVPVLFDPDDHSKVALDMSPQGWADAATASAEQMGALAGNPELAAPIKAMMQAALADPAGFQKHAMEQAEEAFKAAGVNMSAVGGTTGSDATVDALEKLADLHDRGALTDEEFAQQKARILGES
jgi:putative oligomerization/nucleic acid binding protein